MENEISADVLRRIVQFDPVLVNSLARTCKKYNRWLMKDENTMKRVGEHIRDKLTIKIQKQFYRLFVPSIPASHSNLHLNRLFVSKLANKSLLNLHWTYDYILGNGTMSNLPINLSTFQTMLQNPVQQQCIREINILQSHYFKSIEKCGEEQTDLSDILTNFNDCYLRVKKGDFDVDDKKTLQNADIEWSHVFAYVLIFVVLLILMQFDFINPNSFALAGITPAITLLLGFYFQFIPTI